MAKWDCIGYPVRSLSKSGYVEHIIKDMTLSWLQWKYVNIKILKTNKIDYKWKEIKAVHMNLEICLGLLVFFLHDSCQD